MAQEQAVKTIDVRVTESGMEPRTITIPPNYPIRFVIQNATSQNQQFRIPACDYGIDQILPGQTREVTWTFVNVGRFEIVSGSGNAAGAGPRGELVIQAAY